jgi:hypothetical protein
LNDLLENAFIVEVLDAEDLLGRRVVSLRCLLDLCHQALIFHVQLPKLSVEILQVCLMELNRLVVPLLCLLNFLLNLVWGGTLLPLVVLYHFARGIFA